MITALDGDVTLLFNDGTRVTDLDVCANDVAITQNVMFEETERVKFEWPLENCNTEFKYDEFENQFVFR